MHNKPNSLLFWLSLLTLALIGLQIFQKQSPQTYLWLNWADFGISSIFLFSWLRDFVLAKDRRAFMKWGWIDLLLAIPFLPSIWVTYYPILRTARILRSAKHIYYFFKHDSKTDKFFDCCAFCIGLIFAGAMLVFQCEKHVDGANIKNLSDSLWWAMATITTIGYGDRFPVSDAGRIVGCVVMISGVSLFASFTGFIVSKFIVDDRADKILEEMKEMREEIRELKEKQKS